MVGAGWKGCTTFSARFTHEKNRDLQGLTFYHEYEKFIKHHEYKTEINMKGYTRTPNRGNSNLNRFRNSIIPCPLGKDFWPHSHQMWPHSP